MPPKLLGSIQPLDLGIRGYKTTGGRSACHGDANEKSQVGEIHMVRNEEEMETQALSIEGARDWVNSWLMAVAMAG